MIRSSLKLYLSSTSKQNIFNLVRWYSRYSALGRYANMSETSMEVREQKQELRLKMKEKLKNLSQSEKIKQTYINTMELTNHLDFKKTERVAIYVNMKNEVGTYDILKEAFHSKKQVYIPLVSGDDMKMVKLDSFNELKTMPKSKWGIIEPLESDKREDCLESGGVQFVVVPGVAFTSNNLRLGHGKGYYDKFLAKNEEITESRCITVGLAFNEQIVEDLPTNENDFQLTRVVYPNMCNLPGKYDKPLTEFAPPPEPFTI